MSTVASPPRPAPRLEPQAPATAPAPPPVKYWAAAGAILLAAEWIVLFKWVTGPNFERVSSGPDSPPGWMKTEMVSIEVIATLATIFTLYWFLVRPWRRERRVTTDGLLCIAFLTISFFDPLSNFAQNWFTYNSYLVNFGSVMTEIPGVTAFHEAGANEAFPLLIVPTAYVTAFIWLSIIGCKVMSAAKRRWPSIGPGRLVLVCLAFTMLADVVIEGLFYMPLGFWSYAGGHWAINAGHYYQYPVHEIICGGAVFAMFVCLRYFTNDRGETIAERGIDRIRTTPARKVLLRGLAIVAFVHIGFLATYHLPQAIFGLNSTRWPQDVQSRSYFTNHICGPETDRACPGPTVPNSRPDSPYLNRSGGLSGPD
jgi:hypothetical protein